MIKNIVFDIGQVMAEFSWRKHIADLGISGETAKRLGEATVLGRYWVEVDRGALEDAEIIEKCVSLDPEIGDSIREFFDTINGTADEYRYSEPLLGELKALGYNIYLLSNYGRCFEAISRRFGFMKYVDGGVVSYQIRHIKPEPEIYDALINKYSLIPSECLFLDDVEANCEGARKAGINAIRFESIVQAVCELRNYGAAISDNELYLTKAIVEYENKAK